MVNHSVPMVLLALILIGVAGFGFVARSHRRSCRSKTRAT